jgi:pimeloyl-ACP methyl ester carboxylesterase
LVCSCQKKMHSFRIAAIILILLLLVGGGGAYLYYQYGFPTVHTEDCSGESVYRINPKQKIPGYVRNQHFDKVIIFVHGIRDNGKGCWTARSQQYWPELVAHDPKLLDWDVYVYQYEDGVGIAELVPSMFQLLGEVNGVLESHKQVAFVAHSMGGLVVREFLLQYSQLASKVPFIFLFGTPGEGSRIANWVRSVGVKNDQVDDLTTIDTNTFLRSQNVRWVKKPVAIKTLCGFETRTTMFLPVVPLESGSLLCDDKTVFIDGNHAQIVKPECILSLAHISIRNALLRAATIVPPPIPDRSALTKRIDGLVGVYRTFLGNVSSQWSNSNSCKDKDPIATPPQPDVESEVSVTRAANDDLYLSMQRVGGRQLPQLSYLMHFLGESADSLSFEGGEAPSGWNIQCGGKPFTSPARASGRVRFSDQPGGRVRLEGNLRFSAETPQDCVAAGNCAAVFRDDYIFSHERALGEKR